MRDPHDLFVTLGPKARLQLQVSQLESHRRDTWVMIVFAAVVLVLGALSLLSPASFWRTNELEIKISPQVLFVTMMALVVGALYFMRGKSEIERLGLANLQQTLQAESEQAA
ncbi:MAG TPA: hypothetical protein VMV34_04060, partial [Terriglobia bacterium]|nr:hypothetical protein [Terriglobia bacterium]